MYCAHVLLFLVVRDGNSAGLLDLFTDRQSFMVEAAFETIIHAVVVLTYF